MTKRRVVFFNAVAVVVGRLEAAHLGTIEVSSDSAQLATSCNTLEQVASGILTEAQHLK